MVDRDFVLRWAHLAERGWIGEPPSTMEQMRERWIAHHREQGHEPHAAPTRENPERWECQCDPDAVWTAVWRILTSEQIRQQFVHLSKRPTPAREAQRRELQARIAEIQAEQAERNATLRKIDHSYVLPPRIAERYAGGIRQKASDSNCGVIGDTGVLE